MHRRRFLASATATAAGAAAVTRIRPARAAREILVAEPVHSTGYLPLYIAMAKGFFDDVTVKLVTIETGSGHTNAVLSGQAFAFIGGPEHNAFAKAKGAELRAVIGCVDRGNVYLCAAPGQEPKNADWPSYFKGKTIAVGPVGGTPNSILRYLLGKWKLDARRDVTLIETANSATIAVVRGRQAQIGEATEPFVTQGVRNKVWGEPFFNAPKELGPYAYSTINVRLELDPPRAGAGARLRARHGEGVAADLRRACRGRRDRQGAVSHHAGRGSAGDVGPFVPRRNVDSRRQHQPPGVDDRQRRGARGRHPQGGYRL